MLSLLHLLQSFPTHDYLGLASLIFSLILATPALPRMSSFPILSILFISIIHLNIVSVSGCRGLTSVPTSRRPPSVTSLILGSSPSPSRTMRVYLTASGSSRTEPEAASHAQASFWIIHRYNFILLRTEFVKYFGHGRLSFRVLLFELCHRGMSFKVQGVR